MRVRRPHVLRILFVGAALYVGAVSERTHDGRGVVLFGSIIVALVCAFFAARTFDSSRRRALALFGLSLTLAAADAGGHRAIFAIAGTGLAAFVAARSIVSAAGLGGLAAPIRPTLRVDRAVALVWAFALVPALRDAVGATFGYPVSAAAARWIALVGSFVLLAFAAIHRMRRAPYELGAHVRAYGALVAVGCSAAIGGLLAGASPMARFSAFAATLAAGAFVIAHVADHAAPLRTVKLARRAATLGIFAGPVVLVAAGIADAQGIPGRLALIVAALATALVAWFSHVFEEPMLPARGAWLRALEKAELALGEKDDEEAIAQVLSLLREPAGAQGRSPALYLLHPARVFTVDSAGYLREKAEEAPPHLLAVAREEPEATLRALALGPLFVRRPDLRPIARWLSDASFDVVTVVTHEGEPEGLLALGFGSRTDPFTLEEVVALKRVADRLASVTAARSRALRGLIREQELAKKVEEAELRVERLAHDMEVTAARHVAMTTRLSEPMALGFYSPSSRLAYEAIERRVAMGAPLVVTTRSGIDPVPYVARAHLAGPRKNRPFVVVDGTRTREHDLSRWTAEESSPLALAHGGLLVLVDGAALPRDVQALVGRVLAERRGPWAGALDLDVALAFTSSHPAESLSELVDPSLWDRLVEGTSQAVSLPRLSERHEDLRAIVTDRLAREGLRTRGAPVGIDDHAFARLLSYPFPGEDAELRAIATRLVARLSGDVVRAADIDALGLENGSNEAEKSTEPGHIFLVK
jgi:transcriptional regulator with AAA-type ATPase domain